MTDEPNNLVLEHLRALRAGQDRQGQVLNDINLRLGIIEQHIAAFQISEVRQNSELDRLKARMDRIERRLELTDGE